MKVNAAAAASILLPLAVGAQRRPAGGGAPVGAAQYKKMKTIRGSTSPVAAARLPSSASASEGEGGPMEDLAKCAMLGSSDACKSDDSCAWCEAGAVPSACYPSAMTSRLPSGVFDCSASGSEEEEEADEAESTDVEEPPAVEDSSVDPRPELFRRTETFAEMKDGMEYTLDAAEVDKNFCDASSPLSLAGYMNVKGSQFDTEDDKNLFYWFFEKRTTSQVPPGNNPGASVQGDTPLVIWLTGGPGCSSSLALLTENGPCTVNDDGATTAVNPYAWTESAHVLWLDQPADVGYSYGQGNDKNEEMISEDAYYFLQAFFKSEAGAKYKDAPLHIVGESYGGHYAPAIAHRIWAGNSDLKDGLLKLNLSGLAVGNGLTNPELQYQYYAEMAYKNSHNQQVIDQTTYDAMKKAEPMCTAGIKKCNSGNGMLNSFACQAAFAYCNMALTTPYRATGKNPYDISKDCGANPLCYDFSRVEKFMNADSTKKALHVDEHNPSWQTCNMLVNLGFHVDWMKDFSPYVKDLVNAGVRTLIYAGDLDFVCNYMGNRAWVMDLDWDHKADFNAATEHDWNDGAGLARTSNGLTFLQVYDAGHMVPSDQPEHSLTMITQHLAGQAF